jgi:Reverse transcriptase (RNA-dependent DNA polymerase)
MQLEIDAHKRNGTWTLVHPREVEKARKQGLLVHYINSVWKYRAKMENNYVEKLKSRLCVNGMFMVCDPRDTFSPTAPASSVRMIMAITAILGQTVHAGDVPSAYVKAPIDPKMTIFMSQPKGFKEKGKENWVCKLNKVLYGIPPAGKLWNDVLIEYLLEIGFSQSEIDPCVFSMWSEKHEDLMMFSVTTDDFLDFSTCDKMRAKVIGQLKGKFDYLDKGPATWFLGMSVFQTDDFIEFGQEDYIKSIVEGFPDVKGCDEPMGDRVRLEKSQEGEERATIDYQSLCGKLCYATLMRPEIDFALNQCCRFQNDPSMKHQECLMKIV